tara:strand:+ start:1276 stop:2211 length:936 start_codon:yes stop_codon:yes gene_type:complete
MPWMTVVVSFVIIPVLDFFIGKGKSPNLSCFGSFSGWVPRLYFIIHFIILIFYLYRAGFYSLYEIPVLGLALGTIAGAFGITVAHELMHKKNKIDKKFAKLILCSVCYGHFFTEHLKGHHARVATTDDPATAKKNQNLYSFFWQSISGSFIHALRLEKSRLNSKNLPQFTLKNEVLFCHCLSGIFMLIVFYSFGVNALMLFLFQSIVAIILLETTNYIEHYGLARKRKQAKGYVTVDTMHSWNSDHLISNWILLHLPLHSDHHKNMGKSFNELRSIENAPQLPFGYPAMIILAFFPFIYISLMNEILEYYE